MLGYGVLLPVLPFFLERLKVNQADVAYHFSVLTAIFPVTLVLTAPFWGRMADKVGHRPLILLGLIGYTLMQLFIGLSTTLTMLYAVRIIGSVLSSFLIPVVTARISAITEKGDRKKAMAWSGTAVSAGIIIGPGISGLLATNDLHINWMYGHFSITGLSLPFFLLALMGFLVMTTTYVVLKPIEHQKQSSVIKSKSDFSFLKQWTSIRRILLLSLILQIAITLFETVFILYGKEIAGYSISFISISLLVCGVTMAIFQPILAKWAHLVIKEEYNQTTTGFFIAGLTLFFFSFVTQPWIVLVLIALYGLGSSLIVPNLLTAITNKTENEAGTALGWQSSFNGIGQVIGPVGGTLVYSVNKTAPFVFGGILLIGTALFQVINWNNKSKSL